MKTEAMAGRPRRRCPLGPSPAAAFVVFAALAARASPAAAATIPVAPGEAAISDNGLCSLREAVINANDDAQTHADCPAGSGPDQINLPAGTYVLASPVRDTTLVVTSEIVILGAGMETTSINGGFEVRHFRVEPGAVLTLDGVSLVFGAAILGPGAIDNLGTLAIANSDVSANSGEQGGAIRNTGVLSITGTTLQLNDATDSGGAIYNAGEATLGGVFVNRNDAEDDGGAIFNDGGTLDVSFANLNENEAGRDGGAIANTGTGTVAISFATLKENTAAGQGGAIANLGDDVARGELTVTNVALTDNSAAGTGGAILNRGVATVAFGILNGNSANGGGAIRNSHFLDVEDTTLGGNEAAATGGAIDNTGNAEVVRSTLSGNSADVGGAIASDELSVLGVRSSTLSGNMAASDGAAIDNGADALDLRLWGSTLVGNACLACEGGALSNAAGFPGSVVDVDGTIVAESVGANCSGLTPPVASGDRNLDDDGTCGDHFTTGFKTVPTVAVGPLQDNGGPTKTHLPAPWSPVIDSGQQATCDAALVTDQRGLPRTAGLFCDIGSVEVRGLEGVQGLIGAVSGLRSDDGVKKSLGAQLEAAKQAVLREDVGATVNQLEAFVNQVEAQRGKKIGEEDASRLVTGARNTIAILEHPAESRPEPDPEDRA